MRRLAHVQLLILDNFALQPLDATETTDFYELIVNDTARPPPCSSQTASPTNGWP
jgi:DNA replication protein DnaC